MPKIIAPYGQTFPLKTPLVDVECWNFTSGQLFTLPAGLLVKVDHVNDATHTTICVVDEAGKAPGVPLKWTPPGKSEAVEQLGYRFIAENQALGAAIGVPMPKRTGDLVGDIMAYESGEADEKQTKRLFRTLKKTGIGKQLQGHYSSRM